MRKTYELYHKISFSTIYLKGDPQLLNFLKPVQKEHFF
ncbi:hypothetical protein CHCC20375_0919 [Bacillus licheniformis]|nr:hypothetical protein CHCC20375_0919 [Bacillus licheniformis]